MNESERCAAAAAASAEKIGTSSSVNIENLNGNNKFQPL